ncbi:MAG: response regulator [Pseudomonadota bacterium]
MDRGFFRREPRDGRQGVFQLATSGQQSNLEAISVLIVDDERDLLHVLRDALLRPPFEISIAEDGLAAIALLKERRFHIVITDLLMPGADGMEVLGHARSVSPETIIIIITGHATVETAIEAVRRGAYDYIRKPFRLEELEVVMANAAERISLLRENRRLAERLEAAYRQLADPLEQAGGFRVYTSPEAAICGIRPPTGHSMLDALERAVRLRADGVLTQEEFELCKRSLLRRS